MRPVSAHGDRDLITDRPGRLIIADKGYLFAELDRWLAERGVRLAAVVSQSHPTSRTSIF
jgi:hypothetical protein